VNQPNNEGQGCERLGTNVQVRFYRRVTMCFVAMRMIVLRASTTKNARVPECPQPKCNEGQCYDPFQAVGPCARHRLSEQQECARNEQQNRAVSDTPRGCELKYATRRATACTECGDCSKVIGLKRVTYALEDPEADEEQCDRHAILVARNYNFVTRFGEAMEFARVCARVSPMKWMLALLLTLVACKTGEREMPKETAKPPAQVLGQGVPKELAVIALGELAKDPKPFMGKDVVVTGKVDAVCQHMGCWMTLKDANGEAFIRMAGHAFFIPKTASGKTARVHATLVDLDEVKAAKGGACADGEKQMGCKDEAEKQTGKPLAKLELEAKGVELQ
jgi:Domain of unknown function (DUF4920)